MNGYITRRKIYYERNIYRAFIKDNMYFDVKGSINVTYEKFDSSRHLVKSE